MEFDDTTRVSHPADRVLRAMMDDMEEVVPYIETVESIELREREELDDGRVRIVRRWQGTTDSAPRAVRPFVSKEMMAWIDTAHWTPEEGKVEWSLETAGRTGRLYDCSGVNYFQADPSDPENASTVRITGDLVVHPDRFPAPGMMARKLAPQVEKFVVNLIRPNLTNVAQSLQRYLDQQG